MKVIRLPDDRRLHPTLTRKRQGRRERLSRQGARSVTKPHEHHMVAVLDTAPAGFYR